MSKKALITGITGQDGSYLSEFLLKKKYKVHGLVRRVALEDGNHRLWRLRGILDKINLHPASLESYASLVKLIQKIKPDEVYHLGAQSYVDYSFKDEFSTLNTNINGTHYILSAVKEFSPKTKFYFAGSSEMFGKVKEVPQSEKTPFHPRSVYGISKVAGYDLTRNYREAYDMFCCSGILFNHESPRRGFEFVTRKITKWIGEFVASGMDTEFSALRLGNLDAKRDWGHAEDYVRGMWEMVQHETPNDYVVATGETHSVREFLDIAFRHIGIDDWDDFVVIDPEFYRPAEVDYLLGIPAKAKRVLGWEPEISFQQLVERMVDSDVEAERLQRSDLQRV